MCEHALRGQVAFWKVPRFCCGISTRIRIDWKCPVLPLLLKHLETPGRARATMPGRQADPDLKQKSACQRNQNKRPGRMIPGDKPVNPRKLRPSPFDGFHAPLDPLQRRLVRRQRDRRDGRQHPGLHLQVIVLALPCHFLLMRLEFADALPDFVAL